MRLPVTKTPAPRPVPPAAEDIAPAISPATARNITKAVVEVFALRFLENPGVIFLSES